jgi:hypothetical protein
MGRTAYVSFEALLQVLTSPIVENRIAFFRLEAEFETWLAQLEIKHAEFRRVIRSFMKMHDAWTAMVARNANEPGYVAYAKRSASMYLAMADHAKACFDTCGVEGLKEDIPEGETFASLLLAFRTKEAEKFVTYRCVNVLATFDPG